MKIYKRMLSIVVAVALVVSLIPMSAFNVSAATSDYYTYIVENGEATITGCDTSISGDITIPSTLGGYPVTSIGDYAFYDCSGLTSITIGNSVTSIGVYAFYGCYGLTSITIPDSVTSIGDWAFEFCSGLTSITIGNSVTSIGEDAFYNCDSLTSITVGSNNMYYSSQDGVLFNKDKTELIQYPAGKASTTYTIPDSVTSIGDSAFYSCDSLTSITIGNSVTSIGDGAFEYCSGLTSVTIGNSVTSIGDYAFYDCDSLTSITIGNSVTSIGVYAFYGCYGLTSITVDSNNMYYSSQDGVLFNKDKTELIQYPAGKASTTYTIPDSVTSIGDSAFYSCDSLTSITIGNSVTSIGSFAFEYCSGLTSVTIGNSVTSIGGEAFHGCDGLTSITIPDSVTSIGGYAFKDCSGLTSITVDSNNMYYSSQDGVLFNKDKTELIQYPAGKASTTYTIPDSVTSIGSFAFEYCYGLTSITIGNSVTSIGSFAFEYYSSLKDVWYSGSVSDRANISIFGGNLKLENATWHYNICTGEHTYSNACDTSCSNCDWVRETTTAHTYDNDDDVDCNLCGAIRGTVQDFETIEVGQEKTVVLDGGEAYYYFTPDEDGYYSFYSLESDDTIKGSILNSDMEEIASDTWGGGYYDFKVRHKLEAGVTYILKAQFYNTYDKGSFKVCVEKVKYITALEIVSVPKRSEYVEGYVDDIDYDGLKLKVIWSDGSTTFFRYYWDWYIDGLYIKPEESNVEETGIVELTCDEASVDLTFTIIENPVDHIEIVSGTEDSYIENYDGYISENEDGEFFYYYNDYPSDAVIKIVYKNGTSETARVGDTVNDYSISWEHNQYNEPWVVGTNNKSIVTYIGHSVVLPITVKENTVTGIEVVSGKVTCIENAYGYETEDGYRYSYDIPDDVTLKINYTDGTSKVVNINDTVDGYWFSLDDEQWETPWVLGDNNYLTVSYLGVETKLPVSIIASPIDSIVINSAPTREYIYGDTEYGDLYWDGDYEFYPRDMTGFSFTVYYKDGTNETFTDEDIDEHGVIGYINGYEYYLNYDRYNPEIGDFPVDFMYMGKTVTYTVVLKETTVSSIAVTKLPNKVSYNHSYMYSYYPDYIGMELTITYTDNSTKVVTLTEENVVYGFYYDEEGARDTSPCYKVEVDGYTLIIEGKYACYLGVECYIEDITYTEDKVIDSVELDNVSSNGDGMIVKVTYVDDTTEILVLDAIYGWEYSTSYEGFGMTANGILYYDIKTYTDENGKPEYYSVYILDEVITVEADAVVIGDANSDGTVNNLDRLVLTRYLANWSGYTEETVNLAACDLNNDGSVNNLDRLVLTRYLANWEGYNELPHVS